MQKKITIENYERQINNVLNYISQNLKKSFTIDELSKIANFSKFHFLRIFKAFISETVGNFIRRMRLEKAAFYLIYNTEKSITEITFDCGFSSSQNFAKAFKIHYNKSPSEYRKLYSHIPMSPNSNPGNIISNHGKENHYVFHYNPSNESIKVPKIQLEEDRSIKDHVKIQKLKSYQVVYCRKFGKYLPDLILSTLNELFDWAKPHGILNETSTILGVFWDNVAVTPYDKCRYDACIVINQQIQIKKKGIYYQTLPEGYYAIYNAIIENDNFYDHWNKFLKHWLPYSGLELDDRPCYEIYHNILDPSKKTHIIDLCIPIKY